MREPLKLYGICIQSCLYVCFRIRVTEYIGLYSAFFIYFLGTIPSALNIFEKYMFVTAYIAFIYQCIHSSPLIEHFCVPSVKRQEIKVPVHINLSQRCSLCDHYCWLLTQLTFPPLSTSRN